MSILLKFTNFGFMIPGLSQILLWLDSIIYYVADLALRGFFDLVKLSGQITALDSSVGYIMKRAMVLAGIYGLFRLAFMLINYIMDPSKLAEASSKGSSIAKNVVIAMILLVSTPFIFRFMGELQNKIIDSRVIPNIIYGTSESFDIENDDRESKKFVNHIFLLFFDPNGTCDRFTSGAGGGICGTYEKVMNGESGISAFLKHPLSTTFTDFKYTPIISGIMGIFVCYYFITYMISMAVRIVELIILQILSPIPIIMSIDPSNNDALKRYGKTYFEVWLQVFIRILTIYVAFVVCSLVTKLGQNIGMVTSSINNGLLLAINPLIEAVIYVGIFKGAKDIPSLLEKALRLNIGDVSGGQNFGTVIKGAIGGYAGGFAGATAGVIGARGTGAGNMVAAGLAGLAMGGARGAQVAANAKTISGGVSGVVGTVQGQFSRGKNIGNLGVKQYALGFAESKTGGAKRLEKKAKKYDDLAKDTQTEIETATQEKDRIDKILSKNREHMGALNEIDSRRAAIGNSFDNTFEGHGGRNGYIADKLANNKDYQAAIDLLENNVNPNISAADRAELESIRDRAIESASNQYDADRQAYIDRNKTALQNGGQLDAEYEAALKDYNEYCADNDMTERQIGRVGANAQSLVDANGNAVYEGSEEYAKAMNDEDIARTDQEISSYNQQSKDMSDHINDLEQEKKQNEGTAKYIREESPEAKRQAPFNKNNN